ncbi:F0F1 ATP synthase subunit delta [Aliikangiella coralliicola]|uniref:ATP synthase subunit delta n=1 Tax=Aliikangiella coralliicola TaxID=2592383 RepID=A0A545UGL0_9GAMM|nr:F0F1 ATP synthase subunit delta [Aliikangiella coralliicola]TQV88609.1 F0F1 ATP synthase subunit delta [Aliikangiella coralliicola]
MAELTTLARPYAKAAFEHALEAKRLAEWSDMLGFAASVISDESMQQLLTSPHFTKEDQRDAMLKVCQDKLDDKGTNFIKLLARNGRLLALPEIEVLFNFLRSEFEKTIDAQITSATELNEQQITQLKEKLAAKLGRQIEVSVDVDAELLGGLIIQAEDLVIDGSVRGKLAKLSDTLNV